jgi:CO dehydrogenase/acetyl-CoA synthase alpha subunit
MATTSVNISSGTLYDLHDLKNELRRETDGKVTLEDVIRLGIVALRVARAKNARRRSARGSRVDQALQRD